MTPGGKDAPTVDVPGMSVPHYASDGVATKHVFTAFMIQTQVFSVSSKQGAHGGTRIRQGRLADDVNVQ